MPYIRPGLNLCSATKVTATPVATTSAVICAANPKRRGLYIWNNSSNSAYITLGPTAISAQNCAVQLAAFGSYPMGEAVYTGTISAIRNTGSGTIVCTELINEEVL